jgi:hypothetical protein
VKTVSRIEPWSDSSLSFFKGKREVQANGQVKTRHPKVYSRARQAGRAQAPLLQRKGGGVSRNIFSKPPLLSLGIALSAHSVPGINPHHPKQK